MTPGRDAAALRGLLERRAGEWVSVIDLVHAGIRHPSRAVATLQRRGVPIEARSPARGAFLSYRLPAGERGHTEPQRQLGEL